MAVVEEAIYSRLSTHAGVSALVGSRIYPSLMPQNVTLPALTYIKVAGPRVSAMSIDTGVARPRFQVSCWSQTYSQAKALAAQVRAALQRWRGTESGVVIQASFMENEIDLYDNETELHHVALDFEISHEE